MVVAYRAVTTEELLEAFKVQCKSVDDEDMLEYIATVAQSLLEEHVEDPSDDLEGSFVEAVVPYLESFLDSEEAASAAAKAVLASLVVLASPAAATGEDDKGGASTLSKAPVATATSSALSAVATGASKLLTAAGQGGGGRDDLCDTVFSMVNKNPSKWAHVASS